MATKQVTKVQQKALVVGVAKGVAACFEGVSAEDDESPYTAAGGILPSSMI